MPPGWGGVTSAACSADVAQDAATLGGLKVPQLATADAADGGLGLSFYLVLAVFLAAFAGLVWLIVEDYKARHADAD